MNSIKTSFFILFLLITTLMYISGSFAVTYKYDDLDRLVEVVYDDGTTVKYTYDAAGNILKVEVTEPLKLQPIGDKTVNAGQLLTFTVSVTGNDNKKVIFAAYNLPEGAKFDTETGVFSWTPALKQVGVHKGIRFEALVGDIVLVEEITITVKGVNTPVGENVEVIDENSGTTVIFEKVHTPGATTVTVHNELPAGISSIVNTFPVYYNIETNAGFTGKARVKLKYDIRGFEENENDIRLYQFEDGKTIDITSPVNPGVGGNPDTKEKTIEGAVEHFCFFGIGIPNRAPVANAGDDKTFETRSDDGVKVTLDGSLSYDPDASLKGLREPDLNPDGRNIVRYKWTGPFGEAEGVKPTVVMPPGIWECRLIVSDGWLKSEDTVIIHVKKITENGSSSGDSGKSNNNNDSGDKNIGEKEWDIGKQDKVYSSFPYAVFSGSDKIPLSVYGLDIEISGDIHTNNNFLFHGFNFSVDGICKAAGEIVTLGKHINVKNRQAGAEFIGMPEWADDIKSEILKNGTRYFANKSYSGSRASITTPLAVDGDVTINCESLDISAGIFTTGGISLNVSRLKGIEGGKIVICSEKGNIEINASKFELNGLIYAPKGTVVINEESSY
ncbi:putative Ig domain-containing protein [Thermoclostridium stercorarium]|uniref:putative Ig domain-containing protein n=1 Tax=Thermoclostridium stercorarium TaxID=1510 RepID=UPI000A620C30|nr:putative Ig domain-containing protein [Thermoclostridium stercorarium]